MAKLVDHSSLVIKPRRKRRDLLACLVATMIVVGCAGTPAPSAVTPQPPTAGPSATATSSSVGWDHAVTGFDPASWTRCGSSELGASAEMPGACEAVDTSGGSVAGLSLLAVYRFHPDSPGLVTVGRAYEFLLLKVENKSGRALDLTTVRDAIVQASHGKLTRDVPVAGGALPGREVVFEPNSDGQARVLRILANDDALWLLEVDTWQGLTDSADVRRFLDSLKVTA